MIDDSTGCSKHVNHIAFALDDMNELEAMNKRLQVHGVEGVRETDYG